MSLTSSRYTNPSGILLCLAILLAACRPAAQGTPVPGVIVPETIPPGDASETALPSTSTPRSDNLTAQESATLASLEQVADYPLYILRYAGSYAHLAALPGSPGAGPGGKPLPAWGCSLFAALADPENLLYGRNFDWEYSPALLLFTDPPDGYASVSMVDIAYLGFSGEQSASLIDLPLAARRGLLAAPLLPFDGMNEHGLVMGMAAVPPGNVPPDPEKDTVGSLGVIRKVLDGAKNVDEAVAIIAGYNIDFGGGPPIHYLLADRPGRAVLVEFFDGEMNVIPNTQPWHQATNFLRSAFDDSAAGQCWRYDRLSAALAGSGGRLAMENALGLLESVAQDNTQWSVVYGISTGEVRVVLGQQYDKVHQFSLDE